MRNNNNNNNIHADREPVERFGDFFMFKCPHCKTSIAVLTSEINCKIFRCGVLKGNNEPMNPHAQKEDCDNLKNKDMINGCGKPFIFKGNYVEKCGYI